MSLDPGKAPPMPPFRQTGETATAPPSSSPAEGSSRRLSDRSVALAGLGRLALRSGGTKPLFDETVHLIALILRVEFAEILQLQPDGKRLTLVAAEGWKKGRGRTFSVPGAVHAQADYTLSSRTPVVVRDLAKENRFARPSPSARQRIVSGISVIIGTEQEPWGVLGIHTRQRRHFSGRDVHFLQAVSHILSEAINRRHAEAELRDRERRLRLVTDAIPALIAYCDRNLVYRYCNARYTDWFGLKEEDIIGKTVIEVIGPEAFQKIEASLHLALQGQRTALEAELTYRHGPPRHVHVDYIPHFSRTKEVRGLYAMVMDISDRVHAETTRGWLAAIVEHSQDAIIGKTLDGVVTSWNAAAERMYGYAPAEIIGQPVGRLFPPDRQPELRAILSQISRGEAVTQMETVRLHKDGTPLDVMVTVSPIRGEKNQILGASSIAHDMSVYKQAEMARRESEERLRLAKEAAELGIFDWNIVTGEIRWDQRARELWGVPASELISYELCKEAIAREDRNLARNAVKRALDPEGDGRYRAEFRITRSRTNGLTRWIAATGQVTFRNRQPVRMVGTLQDISERKKGEAQAREWTERLQTQLALTQKMEESLRRSNLALEEFTGVVTHDLRTPLASALFTGELLRETLHSDDLQQTSQLLDLVLQSLWQMDELIKQLHSQALADRPEIDQEDVDLNEILVAARERAALLLEKTGGRLQISGPLPTVHGNPAMLAQLFSNLIENAIKYRRSEPPRIRIEASRNDDHFLVTVNDNGRGIPESDRERVFVSRERGSNVGDTPGSGLGLALCRRIMQTHGGSITVATSPEGGAAFELLFPRPEHLPPPPAERTGWDLLRSRSA